MAISFSGKKFTIVIFTLASVVLTFIVYLAPESPVYKRGSGVSLMKVFPSTVAIDPGTAQTPMDGPTVVLGVFGSCASASNTSDFNCVSSAYPAKYDLSGLPSNIPDILLPPAFFTALFWLALWLWALGLVSIYISSVYEIEKYNAKVYAKFVTYIAFAIGFAIWLVAFVFFLKAANDFNACLKSQGPQAPALFAQIGSGFAIIGVAYLFCAGLLLAVLVHHPSAEPA